MQNALTFILQHFDAIVALIGVIGGLVLAKGRLKNQTLRELVTDAVSFAEQYRKTKNPSATNDLLKQKAIDYVQMRLPRVNVDQLSGDIEAAVARMNAARPVLKKPPVRGPDGRFVPMN